MIKRVFTKSFNFFTAKIFFKRSLSYVRVAGSTRLSFINFLYFIYKFLLKTFKPIEDLNLIYNKELIRVEYELLKLSRIEF